jgi:hypothetical protein
MPLKRERGKEWRREGGLTTYQPLWCSGRVAMSGPKGSWFNSRPNSKIFIFSI